MIRILLIIFTLLTVAIAQEGGSGLIVSPNVSVEAYSGPCDLVTCAEAFSVSRALTGNYTGKLFQLYNGTSSLDIGQAANHAADMTTWSSFCSGVPSNCVIAKIYGQINGNVLVPSTVNGTSNSACSGGTNYKCAAPFAIESTTGLPIINTLSPAGTPYVYYNGSLGSDDTAATGITGGTAAVSIVFSGLSIQTTYCCGQFGITHKYNAGDSAGTDWGVTLAYGTPPVCGTVNPGFCAGVDSEVGSASFDEANLANTLPQNVVVAITYNPAGNNTVALYYNNSVLFSNSPPAIGTGVHNPGVFIHLGGGGDLSTPAPSRMREGIITNSTLNSTQQTAIYNNITAFYNAVTAYRGVGDIASAAAYYGLRAYSAATVGNAAINIRRASDSHTCDVKTAASVGPNNSSLGSTANCSSGGDNGQSASSFCNATSCFITEFYDQTGNGNNMTQATTADQPQLIFSCINGLPCASFDGSDDFLALATCPVSATPISFGAVALNTSSTALIYAACIHSGSGGTGLYFSGSTAAECQIVSLNGPSVSALWHSIQCAAGASGNSDVVVDAVDTNTALGNTVFTGNGGTLGGFCDTGAGPCENMTGKLQEAYVYGSKLSVATMQAICQNQSLFYDVPAC